MKRLERHFESERLRQGVTLNELARRCGYQNVTKGCNRIRRFEESGRIDEALLLKLAEQLSIEHSTIRELMRQDREEFVANWNAWADEPVPMKIVIRWIPAVYSGRSVPPAITTQEEAEHFTSEQARHWKKKICLVISRRQSVWFDEHGQVNCRATATPDDGLNQPWMSVGRGKRRPFLLSEPESREATTGRSQLAWQPIPLSTPPTKGTHELSLDQ